MRRLLIGLIFATSLVAAYSCKQGEGEVCQINDDCEEPFTCNAGTGRCQLPGANTPDAAPPPIDAQVFDAEVADAGIDATAIDAGIDAPAF